MSPPGDQGKQDTGILLTGRTGRSAPGSQLCSTAMGPNALTWYPCPLLRQEIKSICQLLLRGGEQTREGLFTKQPGNLTSCPRHPLQPGAKQATTRTWGQAQLGCIQRLGPGKPGLRATWAVPSRDNQSPRS